MQWPDISLANCRHKVVNERQSAEVMARSLESFSGEMINLQHVYIVETNDHKVTAAISELQRYGCATQPATEGNNQLTFIIWNKC